MLLAQIIDKKFRAFTNLLSSDCTESPFRVNFTHYFNQIFSFRVYLVTFFNSMFCTGDDGKSSHETESRDCSETSSCWKRI